MLLAIIMHHTGEKESKKEMEKNKATGPPQ